MSSRLYFSPLWPRLASLGLAACIGYALMELGQGVALPPVERTFPGPLASGYAGEPSPRPDARPLSGFDARSVQQAHVFGESKLDAAPVPQSLVAPDTSLNLILQGTLATETQESARAIISAPDGEGRMYKVKDTLPTGARLQAIYADRVILFRNNRYETLRMPGKKAADADMPQAGGQAAPEAAPAPSPVSGKSGKLAEYRRQVLAKPASMSELVRLKPAEENGRLIGYTVLPGKNPQVLEEFGLQSGDVLTAVNGTTLDSPVKGLSVMQQLATGTRISVEILRNGRPLSLSFSID